MIEGTVENGRRVQAAFPFYSGLMSIEQQGDTLAGAYVGNAPSRAKLPANGTIDGEAVRIIAAERSPLVRAMTLVTLERVAAG